MPNGHVDQLAGPNLYEDADGEYYAGPSGGANPIGPFPEDTREAMASSLILSALVAFQSFGFGQTIVNGKLVAIRSATTYTVEAPITVRPGQTRIRRATLRLYGLISPKKGEAGYDQALQWAKRAFSKVTIVNGPHLWGLS